MRTQLVIATLPLAATFAVASCSSGDSGTQSPVSSPAPAPGTQVVYRSGAGGAPDGGGAGGGGGGGAAGGGGGAPDAGGNAATFDCAPWCDTMGRKCPDQFGPSSKLGPCEQRCSEEVGASVPCDAELVAFLRCALADPGFSCDITVAQGGGACGQELGAYDVCASRAGSGGAGGSH